jgi:hypothetical protein
MNRSVIILVLIAVLGSSLIIWLRPDYDPLLVLGAIGGLMTVVFNTAKTTEIAAKTEQVAATVQEVKAVAVETHLAVNSQLSRQLETAEAAGVGKGKTQGREDAEAREDALSAERYKRSTEAGG